MPHSQLFTRVLPRLAIRRRLTRSPFRMMVLLFLGLGAPALATAGAIKEPPATLSPVTLKDQFDVQTRVEAQPGRPVIVLVADRQGKDAAARWEKRLREVALAVNVRVVSVADLKGAPRILRGVIRRAMPSDTATRVLLDWDGAIAPAVRGAESHLVAAAYGDDGRLQRWESLPLDRESAAVTQRLVSAVRAP